MMLHAALSILIALQIADLWTTRLFLKAGKREANPLVRWLLDHAGWPGVIALKIAVTAGVIAFALAFPVSLATWVVIGLAILLMLWVVAGNLMTLGKL